MLILVWIALAFAVLASVLAAVFAFKRMRMAWRGLRSLRQETVASLQRITQTAADVAEKATRVSDRTAELDQALARLQESRRRLGILTDELADVQASVGRITAFYPRK